MNRPPAFGERTLSRMSTHLREAAAPKAREWGQPLTYSASRHLSAPGMREARRPCSATRGDPAFGRESCPLDARAELRWMTPPPRASWARSSRARVVEKLETRQAGGRWWMGLPQPLAVRAPRLH